MTSTYAGNMASMARGGSGAVARGETFDDAVVRNFALASVLWAWSACWWA